MLVNNINFTVYNTDTEVTIEERIATTYKTTRFWLWIKKTTEDNWKVVNILDDLKTNINSFSSFKDVESKYYEWILIKEDNNMKGSEELAKMFIIFYIQENNIDSDFMQKMALEEIFRDAGGTDFDYDFITTVINNTDIHLSQLKRDIRDTKKNSEQQEEEAKKINDCELDTQQVNIQTSPFEIESIITTLTIKTEKPVLLTHLLNDIDLVENKILFVKYKQFFKINEDPSLESVYKKYEYDAVTDGVLIVFIDSINNYKDSNREILIKEITDTEFNVDVETIDNQVNLEEIKIIFGGINLDIISQSNTKIKGTFLLANTRYMNELLFDELLNNEQFYNFYTNERFKVSKKHTVINVYFYSLKTGTILFTMNNEVSSNSVRVRLKNISSEDYVEHFIKMFVSMFSKYKSREKYLLGVYKKYFPNITLDAELTEHGRYPKNPLTQKEPSLFVPLYSRKCARPPRILEDGEQAPDGFDTMEFPKFGEGGLRERTYVCDQEGRYKFPGLRKNSLPNSDVFPYIPCCYETNQESRKGSPWNAYFKGYRDINSRYEHTLYKSTRIIPNENKGLLPSGITRILGEDSVRKGVHLSPSSFIDCVARLMGDNRYIQEEYRRKTHIEKIRGKLSYEVCAQENYDIKNYQEWFYNNELYFEPRRFFRALEEYYKTNIYIFERSPDHVISYTNILQYKKTISSNGIMSIPNTPPKGSFIDPKKYENGIFVFLHMGSTVDSLCYPHCEYIDNVNCDLTHIKKIYRNILISSRKDYLGDSKNNIDITTIKEQYLDTMGRVVRIKLDEQGETKIVQLKKPMLPVDAPIKYITECSPRKDSTYLDTYVYMKRLARVFVEYCMVKYALSNEHNIDSFLSKYSTIDTEFSYDVIEANYELAYYDTIFQKDGKIVFESEDTYKRIRYSMSKIEKREGLLKFIDKPYITNFYINNLDFYDLVINEQSFKSFAFNENVGYTFNNFLEDPKNNSLVVLRDKTNYELNGYFGVFTSVDVLKSKIPVKTQDEYDLYFVWADNRYIKKFVKSDNGGFTILVFQINSVIYYLGKY